MKEFILVFRHPGLDINSLPEKEMQAVQKKWMDWAGNIAAQGKVSKTGTRLAPEGKVLKTGGVVTDGPFVEIREILGGFMILKADSLDEATTLAHGCPALDTGGSVEIRPLFV
jgi:hypothetical protein